MNRQINRWMDGWMDEDMCTQIQIVTKRMFYRQKSVYNEYKYNITLINPVAEFLNTNGL